MRYRWITGLRIATDVSLGDAIINVSKMVEVLVEFDEKLHVLDYVAGGKMLTKNEVKYASYKGGIMPESGRTIIWEDVKDAGNGVHTLAIKMINSRKNTPIPTIVESTNEVRLGDFVEVILQTDWSLSLLIYLLPSSAPTRFF